MQGAVSRAAVLLPVYKTQKFFGSKNRKVHKSTSEVSREFSCFYVIFQHQSDGDG